MRGTNLRPGSSGYGGSSNPNSPSAGAAGGYSSGGYGGGSNYGGVGSRGVTSRPTSGTGVAGGGGGGQFGPAYGSLAAAAGGGTNINRPGSGGGMMSGPSPIRAASAGVGSRGAVVGGGYPGGGSPGLGGSNRGGGMGATGTNIPSPLRQVPPSPGTAQQQQQQQYHQQQQVGGGGPTTTSSAGLLRSLRPGSSGTTSIVGGAHTTDRLGGAQTTSASASGTVSRFGAGSSLLGSSLGAGRISGQNVTTSVVGTHTPSHNRLGGGIQGQHLGATSPAAASPTTLQKTQAPGGSNAPAFSCTVLASSSRASSKPLQLHFGSGCTQGFRPTMEDEHVNLIGAKTVEGNPMSLFAVLDGHCGRRVAELGSQMLPEILFSHPLIGQNNAQAFVESIMQVDKQIYNAIRNQDGGATLIAALVHKRMLFVACVGDARAVLCDSGSAVPMSVDHKPSDPSEQARIVRCGGFVHFGRVSGCLAVSRALGDFEFKCSMGRFVQKEFQVSNVADIRQINLTDGSKFLIVACDGLWDVMSNEEAVSWVRDYLAKNEQALLRNPHDLLTRAGQALAEAAVAKGSTDNVSATIVLFHNPGGH